MPEEGIVITVEVGWQVVVLLTALTAALIAALVSGAFHELSLLILRFFNVPLAELSLSRESFRKGDLVEIRLCVSKWIKADELEVYVFSLGGSIIYHSSSIGLGPEGCTSISLRALDITQDVYIVAVVQRHHAIVTASFKVAEILEN